MKTMVKIILLFLFSITMSSCIQTKERLVYHDQVQTYVSIETGDTLRIAKVGSSYYVVYGNTFFKEMEVRGGDKESLSTSDFVLLIMIILGAVIIFVATFID